MQIDGETLLHRVVKAATGTRLPTFVALPRANPPRHNAIKDLSAQVVDIADPSHGMGASIAAAVRAAKPGRIMVIPADMPGVTTRSIAALIDAASVRPDLVWRGMDASGTPGHPVLFPARLYEALAGLQGDDGARALMKHEDVMRVGLPGQDATLDLDTPEAWAAFRQLGSLNSAPAS